MNVTTFTILSVVERICGYTLYVSKAELPFEVVIKDPTQGHAEVVLAPGYSLSYSKRHRYTFELAAHDCDKGHRSARYVAGYVKNLWA